MAHGAIRQGCTGWGWSACFFRVTPSKVVAEFWDNTVIYYPLCHVESCSHHPMMNSIILIFISTLFFKQGVPPSNFVASPWYSIDPPLLPILQHIEVTPSPYGTRRHYTRFHRMGMVSLKCFCKGYPL